jgi:hypothetical protein
MKVYYILTTTQYIGCLNRHKLETMYRGKKIYDSDITEFKGHLLGSEWLG